MNSSRKIVNYQNLLSDLKEMNLAFAAWKSPKDKNIKFIAGKCVRKEYKSVKKNEFIISSFENDQLVTIEPEYLFLNENEKIISILYGSSLISKNDPAGIYYFSSLNPEDRLQEKRDFYINLVRQGISTLEDKYFPKVVLARKKLVATGKSFNPVEFFLKLIQNYPDAFIYLMSSPLTGTWTGASPELLLSHHNDKLKTVSLAGTRSDLQLRENIQFTDKERIEQELVSLHIRTCFQNQKIEFAESEPEMYRAGKVIHIRTVFECPPENVDIETLINDLHPTPAVSGYPKEKAVHFIKETEKINRKWYSGFLGFYNNDSDFEFYVNLRCMEIKEKQAVLYAGAGILKDSDPEAEWLETENKLQTLLSLIELQKGSIEH